MRPKFHRAITICKSSLVFAEVPQGQMPREITERIVRVLGNISISDLKCSLWIIRTTFHCLIQIGSATGHYHSYAFAIMSYLERGGPRLPRGLPPHRSDTWPRTHCS